MSGCRCKELAERLAKLEEQVREMKPKVEDDLGDILRSFPGGLNNLALSCGYHRESLYAFANGKRTKGFPFKRAMHIARAFGDRRALGKRVTINRLRSSWQQQHQKNSEEGVQR